MALATPERLVFSASFSTERGRHGPLFGALADIQHRHKDLAGLLVVTGPGSWTSIRVGLGRRMGALFESAGAAAGDEWLRGAGSKSNTPG